MASSVLATFLVLYTKDGQQLYVHANQQLFYNETGEASFIVCAVERWSKAARGGDTTATRATAPVSSQRMGPRHALVENHLQDEREIETQSRMQRQDHKHGMIGGGEDAESFHLVGGKKKRKRVTRGPPASSTPGKRGRPDKDEEDEEDTNRAGRKGGEEERREEDAVRLLGLVKKRHN